jgi:uncharacterized membrane protein YkvI
MITRMKQRLEAAFGASAGAAIFFLILAVNVVGLASGSIALDAWFGTPGWLSVAIMIALAFMMPPVAFVLAIIGLFYWLV